MLFGVKTKVYHSIFFWMFSGRLKDNLYFFDIHFVPKLM